MKKPRGNISLATVLTCLFILSTVIGQDVNKDVAPSGKILEVSMGENKPPAKIPLRTDRPTGFWTPVLPRMRDWQPPAGQEPFQVISFSAQLVGDKADFGIAAVSGKGAQQKVVVVGDYLMSVGDSITVTEVKKFGFEPITIRMTQMVPIPAGVPVVDNRTQSLSVAVTPAASTLPSFNFHLTNNSKKSVMAVAWRTHLSGRFLLSAQALGEHGKALMEPGGKHDMTIRTGTEDNVAAGVTLVIDGVVFEDGTFEGSSGLVAVFRSVQVGHKRALARLLPILDEAKKHERIDIPSIIGRVEGLREKATEADAQIKASYDALIRETVAHLRRYESTLPKAPESELQKSLVELTDLYQTWFDRLSRYE